VNSTPTTVRRLRCWQASTTMLLLFCWGCGPSAQRSDPVAGQAALQLALDAWKDGKGVDTLAQRTPPIHVADGDWKSGLALQSYSAETGGKPVGTDVNYNVILELKTAAGKVVKKNAVYTVATQPQLMVLRQDD
jgi:hypothetical protein